MVGARGYIDILTSPDTLKSIHLMWSSHILYDLQPEFWHKLFD